MAEAASISARRAYEVTEPFESRSAIVFATSNIEGRRYGANALDCDEIGGLRCRRAPWADQFAENGRVPASACVAHGWRFEECSGCGSPLSDDDLDERGLSTADVVGESGGAVYCCQACKDREDARTASRHGRGAECLTILREIVLARFPGVTFETGPFREYAYVTEDQGALIVRQASVSFNFPGQKIAPASLHWDDSSSRRSIFVPGRGYRALFGPPALEWRCCAGDKTAFESFALATREASR